MVQIVNHRSKLMESEQWKWKFAIDCMFCYLNFRVFIVCSRSCLITQNAFSPQQTFAIVNWTICLAGELFICMFINCHKNAIKTLLFGEPFWASSALFGCCKHFCERKIIHCVRFLLFFNELMNFQQFFEGS